MSLSGVPVSWAERHCLRMAAEGVAIDRLFDDALVERRFGDDRDRMSAPQLALFYYHANLSIEDEGRRNTASRIPLGFGALAVRAFFGCSTLEAGLGAMARLAEITASPLRIALAVEQDEARFIVFCEDTDGEAASLEDAYLTFFFMCINGFLGAPLPLLGVETRDPRHMNLGRAHWAGRAPVSLGRLTALRFPKAALLGQRAMAPRDDMFWDIFRGWIDFIDGARPARPRLPAGLDELVVGSGVSRSTIRRRLDQEGGGFKRQRQAALAAAGLDLLLNTRDSVDAIAVELGYSDARSFRRFLKTATGKAPAEWRLDAEPPPPERTNEAVRHRIESFSRALDRQLSSVPL